MADNQLDILIKFGLSKEKATEAVAELKKVEEAGKNAGDTTKKSAEEAALKHSELNKIVGKLAHDFPIFGEAARLAMNPMVAGLITTIKLANTVREAFRQLEEQMNAMEESNARSVGLTAEDFQKLKIAAISANEAFKDFQQGLSSQATNAVANINAQKEALIRLANAEEKIAIARAGDDEKQVAAIKQRGDLLRQQLGLDSELAQLQQKSGQFNELRKRQLAESGVAHNSLGGRTPESAATTRSSIQKQIADLDVEIAEKSKRAATLEHPGPFRQFGYDPEKTQFDENGRITKYVPFDPKEKADQELAALRERRSGLVARDESLARGIVAAGNTTELGKQIVALTQEMARANASIAAGKTESAAAAVVNAMTSANDAQSSLNAKLISDFNAFKDQTISRIKMLERR